jgi:hypothetical protein
MQNIFLKFFELAVISLVTINAVSFVVGGLWLAIDGVWGAIGKGLIMGFVAAFLLSLAMTIAAILLIPSNILYKKNYKVLSYISLAPFAIVASFIISMFYYYVMAEFIQYKNETSPIAIMLWSSAVAIGSLGMIAGSGPQSQGFGLFMIFSQLGFYASLTALYFSVKPFNALAMAMSVTLVGLIISGISSIKKSDNH